MEIITNVSSEVPSPIEWVEEHYSLANLINSLTDTQQIFFHGCMSQSRDDSELVIDYNIKDLLQEKYGDKYLEYLEKYLLQIS